MALQNLLRTVQLQENDEDVLQRKWSKDLTFSVKSTYAKWEEQQFLRDKDLVSVWKNVCPPKVEVFAWMAIQNSIASRNEVILRNEVWEVEEIIDLAKTRMAIWIKGKYNIKIYSVEDFKRNLDGIRRLKIETNH
ncbi:hypothetical protein Vadar_018222 [Vaccinium darrowii]|uniref:Uncharacterized protein n=1 Tax=Vaccinium darrowii TaxID=229202 RepID=A0ACB7Y8V4_9ERIC|nr:hypothetical protein Vadar_018222 [Vaccinium darrowii]